MRIVSVNAWGGAMLDGLTAWLTSCEADVICLQEVCRTPGARATEAARTAGAGETAGATEPAGPASAAEIPVAIEPARPAGAAATAGTTRPARPAGAAGGAGAARAGETGPASTAGPADPAGATGWIWFDDGERSFPQRADLHGDVARTLPDHQALFLACDSGPVLDSDGVRRRQDFGVGTYVAPTVPVIGLHSAFVHGEYRRHEAWPMSNRPRAALAVRVADPVAGRVVTVVQLHGLRDRAGKHDTAARDEQARRLAALVQQARGDGDVVVVCGDLNLLPDSRTFGVLADIGLTDLVGDADTRTSRYDKSIRHAGYLLVSDPVAVKSFTILAEPEVSDHRPLILDL